MLSHRIYSCDDHLDINAMPKDAWSSRLPAKYREAGPITALRDGKNWWTINGETIGVQQPLPRATGGTVDAPNDVAERRRG